jgi:hypothetical protein
MGVVDMEWFSRITFLLLQLNLIHLQPETFGFAVTDHEAGFLDLICIKVGDISLFPW